MLRNTCFAMAITFMFAAIPMAMAGDKDHGGGGGGGGGSGSGRTVRIRDTVNGKCVTVGDQPGSTAEVTMEKCKKNDPDQQWRLDQEGGPNTFRFISKSTKLCLTVPDENADPVATTCSDDLDQQFIITLFLSDFTFQLFNRGANQCLEVGGAGNRNLQSRDCDDESDQHWRLELLKNKAKSHEIDASLLGIEEFSDAVDDTEE